MGMSFLDDPFGPIDRLISLPIMARLSKYVHSDSHMRVSIRVTTDHPKSTISYQDWNIKIIKHKWDFERVHPHDKVFFRSFATQQSDTDSPAILNTCVELYTPLRSLRNYSLIELRNLERVLEDMKIVAHRAAATWLIMSATGHTSSTRLHEQTSRIAAMPDNKSILDMLARLDAE